MEVIKRKFKNNLFKNSLIIMYGQTISSIISFVSTIILVKGIGLGGIGMISIVQSYSAIFNGIFNFQSYNAVIKFGAEALEKKDFKKYKGYLKQAFLQDIITACIAFIFGMLFINLIAGFMKWDVKIIFYIKIYLITILFNISGSINGLLRLNNEFKPGAKIAIITAIIKVTFLSFCLIFKAHIFYYILVELFLAIINNLMFFISGYKCLKKNKCLDFINVKISFDKEFTMFNFYNNIVSTIDMPTGQLINIIINKFLGFSEVGIYNILVKLGTLVTKIIDPVVQALLPELSKYIAKNENIKAFNLVKKIFVIVAIGTCISVTGIIFTYKIWLPIFMMATYENLVMLIIYIVYIGIISSIAGVHLLFVSLNLVKYNLPITLSCNLVYIFLLYILVLSYGLVGIIVALIIQAIGIATIKYFIMIKKGCFKL